MFNRFLSTNLIQTTNQKLPRPKSSVHTRKITETIGEKGSQCRLSTVLATGEEEQPINYDKYAGQEIYTLN